MTATPEIEAWLDGIHKTLNGALDERKRRDRRYAPRFNVFRAATIQHRELSHSAFLAELLDPKGAHGQGRLFLDRFLKRCIQKSNEWILPDLSGHECSVSTEYACEEGRIDILLRHSHPVT